MPSSFIFIIAISGVLILALMAWYAHRLWREVRRREAARREEIARANRNCIESLEAISKALVDDQIDPVEGALRCRVLLDILDVELVQSEPLRVFATVQERAAHLKTHKARRELSARQRHREDMAREAIASEHSQALKAGATAVQELCRRWQTAGSIEVPSACAERRADSTEAGPAT